ncbi:MAG TPA: mammalian cell entry protein, partial [Mycobacterium sp.]|nr:mammalian cell entry protein [Mycobacterium sp.]
MGGSTAVDTEVADAEAVHVDPDSSDGDDENADAATEDDEAADEPVVVRFRERRPATKWSVIAATVAAALFVGSAAFAGA